MMAIPQPHDLVWISDANAIISQTALPCWVQQEWNCQLPLVVRRDFDCGTRDGQQALIPIGIRGQSRSHRAAAWLAKEDIIKIVTPEATIGNITQLDVSEQPLLALSILTQYQWPWDWGVTGGCGYSLASGQSYLRSSSDLDLLIRCPTEPSRDDFNLLLKLLPQLPCHVDIQLETPNGGCALLEWLRGSKVLLKTNLGPKLVANPWKATI